MEYVIETRNLTKQYRDRVAVDSLNLHVPKGKIYGLMGRNGAGKTTAMKMLLKLVRPTGGSILLFGEDTAKTGEDTWHRIGAMIEGPGFYENLTAEENLKILAKLRGQHRKDTVENALSVVGLQAEKNRCYREFSLGMKQRLGIAAAIMHEPELLLLDEPTNGLDPIGIQELRKELLRLCRERGTTIFVSSHVLNEIEQLADWVGVMHEGRLLEERDMQKLHEQKRQYVEFKVSDVNAAILVLERQFRISDYAVPGEGRLRVYRALEHRAEINSGFVKNGIVVADISVCEEKLEDYFKKLIGGGESDLYDSAIMFLMLLFAPLVMSVVAVFLISREYAEHTLKTILAVPVARKKFLMGKFIILFFLVMLFCLLSWLEILLLACICSLFITMAQITVISAVYFLIKMLYGGVLLYMTLAPIMYLALRMRGYIIPFIVTAGVCLFNVVLSASPIAELYPWTASYLLVSGRAGSLGCPRVVSFSVIALLWILSLAGSIRRFLREDY